MYRRVESQTNHIRRIFFKLSRDEWTLLLKNAVIIVAAVVSLAAVCMIMVAIDINNSDSFPKGIVVNDVELYGMTMDDAVTAVTKSTDKHLSSIEMPVVADGNEYVISATEFVKTDVKSTVKDAYEAGQTLTEFEHGEGKFYTTYYIDTDALKSVLERIATETYVEPVEPEAVFDKESRTFIYTDGNDGSKLNVTKALEMLVDKFENSDYGQVELDYDVVKPNNTLDEIKANTVLVSEYTSSTTNNYNRNKNIELMCSYVNGCVIEPGGVLSINELVGERTEEKGFLPAPAIMDGKRTVDDIGGGICQLSGTLYNTALRANMRIVERWPHSWPSEYVDIGLDSTLDWNTEKDLKIMNITKYNMYLAAWLGYSNLSGENVLHVAAYGQPFPKGVTVKVYSEITETTAPDPVQITYTTSLSPGSSRVVIKERTGYKTRVWREFYCDGDLLDAEIVGTSTYAPIRGEIRVGKSSGYAQPTTTPNPTYQPPTEPQDPNPSAEPVPSEDPIVEPPAPTDPPYDDTGET